MPRGKQVWNLDLSPSARNVAGFDRNSCTAHALAAVLNCPLHTAQTITFCAGRKAGAGWYVDEIMTWCNQLAPGMFTKVRQPFKTYLSQSVANFYGGMGKDYYIVVPGHALAIVKGEIVDSAQFYGKSIGKELVQIWELSRTDVTAETLLTLWQKRLEF